jgi:hypothetical protein
VVNRLETSKQGKRTAEELNTEFLQIVGQAGMDRKTPSDHLHLIGYYRKALEPRLDRKILFSNNVPKMIDGWMEKAIQFDTRWKTYSSTQTWRWPHLRKQTPTKATGMHVGGEWAKEMTLMQWMLTH